MPRKQSRRLAGMFLATALIISLSACVGITLNEKGNAQLVLGMREKEAPFSGLAIEPLADAVARGDVRAIAKLARSADLNARGDKNVTLLEWSIFHQKPRSLEALLAAGADPTLPGMDNESAMHLAAMIDTPRYLSILLEHKAPLEVAHPTNQQTPVFYAVRYRQPVQLDMLIAAGANLHHRDLYGNSLLHRLATNDYQTALILLNAGVDPTLPNNGGRTFQPSFFRSLERLLTDDAKIGRERVRQWLLQHNIPLETSHTS